MGKNKLEYVVLSCEYAGSLAKKNKLKTLKFDIPASEYHNSVKVGLMIGNDCEVILKQGSQVFEMGKMFFDGLNIKKEGNAQLKLTSENAPLGELDQLDEDSIILLKIVFSDEIEV